MLEEKSVHIDMVYTHTQVYTHNIPIFAALTWQVLNDPAEVWVLGKKEVKSEKLLGRLAQQVIRFTQTQTHKHTENTQYTTHKIQKYKSTYIIYNTHNTHTHKQTNKHIIIITHITHIAHTTETQNHTHNIQHTTHTHIHNDHNHR